MSEQEQQELQDLQQQWRAVAAGVAYRLGVFDAAASALCEIGVRGGVLGVVAENSGDWILICADRLNDSLYFVYVNEDQDVTVYSRQALVDYELQPPH